MWGQVQTDPTAYDPGRSLPAMMLDCARKWPERPMLRTFRDGAWRSITWAEFARQVASAADTLRREGIGAGDRVMIVAENRPEYPVAETALMAIGAVPVPAYVSNTIDDHAHILRDSASRAAIVASTALAERVQKAGERAGGLELIVAMDGLPESTTVAPRHLPWSALVEHAQPPDIATACADISPDAIACLIYTSGTGGAPKGVMLSHRAMLSNCRGAHELLRPLRLKHEVYLSYLPTAHSYEHTVGLYFLPSIGTEIVYARGVDHLAADLMTVRPTILTAVPRVLEVIRARVLAQVARQPAARRRLFDRALAIGLKRLDGHRLTLAEQVLDPLLDRLVRAKVRARFGGRLIALMSGGARLDPDVGRFFLALGLKVMQGYGQTEAGPVISANPPDAIRIDSVGKVLQGVTVRIATDGEILVRGDLVMDGYWGLPEQTAAAIREGWLHTGDIGTLDADGYLRITDRKKDMIVLSGGENVSPAKIEGMLAGEPEISQAVVAGDGRAALCALIVPADGCDGAAVAAAVSRANLRLSVTERVRHHATVPPFTVEDGLLTPSQKLRRAAIMQHHADILRKLQM